MNDRRSLIRNSVRSSERLFAGLNDKNFEHHHRIKWRSTPWPFSE